MLIAKLWNKRAHRYTGRCMRPKGTHMVYTNFKALEQGLKSNTDFYGDTEDLEVHVFELINPKHKLEASSFFYKEM